MGLSVVKSAIMPDINEYVTIEDAVQLEEVTYTPYWLRRLAQEGKIEAFKVGPGARGQWLIHKPSLLRYIKSMKDLGAQKHNPHE